MRVNQFVPFEQLARVLLAMNDDMQDGSHDASHLERVWKNAKMIQCHEGGDLELIAAAVLLHDCVQIPKDSPLRPHASSLAAKKARAVLDGLKWDSSRVDTVADAIVSHSFSARIAPTSLEGCILQDADRLDAIGLIGIARCFYTAGRLGSELYDALDPRGKARPLDDGRFALDHFPRKRLTLADGFTTATGQHLAWERHRALLEFYEGALVEIEL